MVIDNIYDKKVPENLSVKIKQVPTIKMSRSGFFLM